MFDALAQSLSAVFVLIAVASCGYYTAMKGWYDAKTKLTIAKIVNFALPCFLFSSITSRFTQQEFLELLSMSWLPFGILALDFLISWLLTRLHLVRQEICGLFIACFTPGSLLFVGIPLTLAMFGEKGIPYLLLYFFANVTFVWTIGIFNIQLDGCRRNGGQSPQLISMKSLRMLLSPPLIAFLVSLVFVYFSIPIPKPVALATKLLGQLTSPLALIFIGITIQKIGFGILRHPPRELCLILAATSVIRPLVTYLCLLPFELDPLMRQVLVVASAMPVTSVVGVLSKRYGADEEFASEAVGATTAALVFTLPVLLFMTNFI